MNEIQPGVASPKEKSQGRAAVTLPPPHPTNEKWWLVLAGLALIALTLLVYYPVFHAGYDWDDVDHFRDNPFMVDLTGLKDIWLNPRQQLNPIAYFPVTLTAFWIQYHIFGTASAGPYHVVSVGLHAVNVLLVWWVLRRLKIGWSWLGAAIFAIHPLQVETVAWAAEQKNLLSTLFYLLAAGSYLKFVELERSPKSMERRAFYGLSLVLFALAMLSKAVVVTFPAVILLVLWWKRGSLRQRDIVQLIPAGIVALAISLFFVWVNMGVHSQEADLSFSMPQRIAIAGRALWFYLGKFVWPVELLEIYPLWNIVGNGWDLLYPMGIVAGLAGLWALRKRLTAGPLVGVLIFVLSLSPALGFISFSYMRFSFVANHFTYLANLGLIALFVELLRIIYKRFVRHGVSGIAAGILPQAACATAMLVVLVPLSWSDARLHADVTANWQYTVQHNPQSWIAHAMLAGSYVEDNKFEDAVRESMASAAVRDNETALEIAAVALLRGGHPAEASAFYERIIGGGFATPATYLCYGRAQAQLGRYDSALAAFQESVKGSPRLFEAWNGIAVCQLRRQHWADAAQAARACLAVREDYYMAHGNLAVALQHLGDLEGATFHYRRVLELKPQSVMTMLQLANCLLQRGDLVSAAGQFRQVTAQDPRNVEAHEGLAKILPLLGDSAGGQREQQIVVELTRKNAQ